MMQGNARVDAGHRDNVLWPPMVVIMNTQLEQDENGMWLGMGNQELLGYFPSYNAVKARHAYGPKGHRGISMLIFEASAAGYTEAERLSKHFEIQGMDRDAWIHSHNLFCPDGKRQLYGYMATRTDMDIFNQHSPRKSKLKFELVSYQEKVGSKALEVSQKLQKTEEENCIDRDRTQWDHEARKKDKWYADFFSTLDTLTVEQINERRPWHCPVCSDGPGSMKWYLGLQPLMTHAKTKGSHRVKIHRHLAEILEEELRRRGATVVPAGKAFGQWKGFNEVVH